MNASSAQPLYGLRPLLNGLVPRMVMGNEDPDAARGLPQPGPMVELLGGRLSGKSAALTALRTTYARRTPMAWADLAHPALGQTGLDDIRTHVGPRASLTTHLLYLLASRLGEDVPGMRRLEFPRLSLGLLMATAWRSGEDDDAPVLPARYGNLVESFTEWLEGQDSRRRTRERKRRLPEVISAITRDLATVMGLPDTIAEIIPAIVRRLLEYGNLETPTQWWGQRLREVRGVPYNDDLWCLIALRGLFREESTRADAEEDLIAALLDDIDAYYTRARLRNGAKRPLILLDNAHAAPGPQLLALLHRGYDARATRPVVVTAALDDGVAPRPAPLGEVAAGQPDGGVVRLALPPLSGANVRAMLTARQLPLRLRWPIARFSGGRAGCAHSLVDAAAGGPAGDPPGGAAGGAAGDGELVSGAAEELLRRLLPHEETRGDLIRLAPALDEEAAHRLWRTQAAPRTAAGGLEAERRFAAVRRELAAGHWERRPWPWPPEEPIGGGGVPFVPDRALRALLLHRLATAPPEGDAQLWSRTHLFLRSVYNPRGRSAEAVGHTVPYLHHTLALNDAASVVRCLHDRFTRSSPREWLAAVNAICAAPRPPSHLAAAADEAGCPACATPNDRDAHEMIAQLVDFVWRHSGPLAAVPAAGAVPQALTNAFLVFELRNRAFGSLGNTAASWYEALAAGIQPPDLPAGEEPSSDT